MKKIAFLAFVLAITLTGPAFAELKKTDVVVEAGEGAVTIEGGDYIDARQRAKDAALRYAMWKAVFALSSPEQIEKNKNQITARIINNAIEYVHSFKFNDEKIDVATTNYVVSLEVSFFSANISRALENIGLEVAGPPNAVIVLDDRPMGMIAVSGFLLTPSPTENMISEAADEAGLKPVNRTKLRTLKNDDEIIMAVKGEPAALKWLGGQFNAELVMVGSTSAVSNGGKITGTVTLKIFNGRTAEPLWGKEVSETVESGNQSEKFRTIRLSAEKMKGLVADFLNARKDQAAKAPN